MIKIISYAHKDDPQGIRFIQPADREPPDWAVDIVYDEVDENLCIII